MAVRATATISEGALQHNLSRVRRYAPQSQVMVAVKADAYGHGAVFVARTLAMAGCDALAVATFEEAQGLRAAGITLPIAILNGIHEAGDLQRAATQGLQLVIHDLRGLEVLEGQTCAKALSVWLKLDSGMHRLGLPLEAAAIAAQRVQKTGAGLAGWMTHLACADEVDNPFTQVQIRAFEQALVGRPEPRSIGNSAGIVAWPESRSDWVRPGIMLYGGAPLADGRASEHDLRPVMRFSSRLLSLRKLSVGEGIGYGLRWRTPENMLVGVVGVGYGDGYPRHIASGTPVVVCGRQVPVIGRVSMDLITIDLRGCPIAHPGDEVLLWGEGLPVEDIAQAAGTINYELFCQLTSRVVRQPAG